MTLIFASSNQNKINEIKALIPKSFTVKGLRELSVIEEIPETGTTLKENSLIKANYVRQFLSEKNDVLIFADDSGLEVEALNNAPGIYSARYAGIPKDDKANNKKLLSELNLITNRKAKFITIITLLFKNEIYCFEGHINGTIAFEERGKNGFGYDPLFIPQGYRSTFAELNSELKNNISHRGIAVNKLIDFLKKI